MFYTFCQPLCSYLKKVALFLKKGLTTTKKRGIIRLSTFKVSNKLYLYSVNLIRELFSSVDFNPLLKVLKRIVFKASNR